MSVEVLQRLSAERRVESSELADLLNLSRSAAFRYFSECELRHGQLRTLVRHARDRQAAEALVRSITDGTEFALMRIEHNLDLDGDGDIDCDDVLTGAIRVNRGVGTLLELIHQSLGRKPIGQINTADADDLAAGISELLGWLAAVQKIIGDEADRQRRRKRAHPFGSNGASRAGAREVVA
jgi:hypothetical protein